MSNAFRYPPVLILGASPRISLPVARSLYRHGIPVDIASFQPEECELRSRSIRGFHRVPPRQAGSARFANALLTLIREKGFDSIFAAGDPSLAALADYYDELGALVKVGCPPPAAVELVLNKSMTLETAQRCAIRIPFTRRIASLSDLQSIASELPVPIVVKPEKKGGAGVSRVFYFHNVPELSQAFQSRGWTSVLLQEFCPGVGIGIEILIHKGDCLAKFQHRRLKEAPATGGVAVIAISEEPDPELVRISMTLLRALEWEGIAVVEFRVDRQTGSCVLMEVNGRYWGSVSLPIMAGVDFPLYHWQILHGETPSVPSEYLVGMRWRWSPGLLDRMQSMLSRKSERVGPAVSKLSELLSSCKDFSPQLREALWSWNDPRPFFDEMSRAAGAMSATALKSASRKVVPKQLRSYADIRSRLIPKARSEYSKLRLNSALHLGSAKHHRVPASARTFLFVCHGNLMRSPMAEAMFQEFVRQRGINGILAKSAGLHAVTGRPAHQWALAVSRELGLPLDHHRAQPVTAELISSSDAIFAMDFENLAELNVLFPTSTSRIFILSAYADGLQHNREIPDPFFGDIEATRRCYSVLRKCIEKLVRELDPKGRTTEPNGMDSTERSF
jgi:protein-tyrosine-phosphatase/predicted ATP-grasp superfamily ATP-dependent carboligase